MPKEGRRHAHVVWSRINPEEMKAINLPHFKNRLRDLSKELYLEHEWTLPEGHRENGWKNPVNRHLMAKTTFRIFAVTAGLVERGAIEPGPKDARSLTKQISGNCFER